MSSLRVQQTRFHLHGTSVREGPFIFLRGAMDPTDDNDDDKIIFMSQKLLHVAHVGSVEVRSSMIKRMACVERKHMLCVLEWGSRTEVLYLALIRVDQLWWCPRFLEAYIIRLVAQDPFQMSHGPATRHRLGISFDKDTTGSCR